MVIEVIWGILRRRDSAGSRLHCRKSILAIFFTLSYCHIKIPSFKIDTCQKNSYRIIWNQLQKQKKAEGKYREIEFTIKSIQSILCFFRCGEAHKAKSFTFPTTLTHHSDRCYSSKTTEKFLQLLLINKDIEVLHIQIRSLQLIHMGMVCFLVFMFQYLSPLSLFLSPSYKQNL